MRLAPLLLAQALLMLPLAAAGSARGLPVDVAAQPPPPPPGLPPGAVPVIIQLSLPADKPPRLPPPPNATTGAGPRALPAGVTDTVMLNGRPVPYVSLQPPGSADERLGGGGGELTRYEWEVLLGSAASRHASLRLLAHVNRLARAELAAPWPGLANATELLLSGWVDANADSVMGLVKCALCCCCFIPFRLLMSPPSHHHHHTRTP